MFYQMIDYMVSLAKRIGFKLEFALAISNIFGDGAKPGEVKPTSSEFQKAIKKIIKYKEEGAPILFSKTAYKSVLDSWPDFSIEGVIGKAKPEGMPTCPAGRIFGLVGADGKLWACPHLMGKTKVKNALKTGVAEAWKTAGKHNCRGCYQVYHHEFGLLSELNLAVLWNYFKFLIGD